MINFSLHFMFFFFIHTIKHNLCYIKHLCFLLLLLLLLGCYSKYVHIALSKWYNTIQKNIDNNNTKKQQPTSISYKGEDRRQNTKSITKKQSNLKQKSNEIKQSFVPLTFVSFLFYIFFLHIAFLSFLLFDVLWRGKLSFFFHCYFFFATSSFMRNRFNCGKSFFQFREFGRWYSV